VASTSDRLVQPWELRLVRALPLPHWLLGLAIAGCFSLVTLLVTVCATPLEQPRSEFELRLPYMIAVVLGYVLAAYRYAIAQLRVDVDELRPYFTGSDADHADVMRSIRQQPRLPMQVVGIFGLVLGIVIPEVFTGRFSRLFISADWNLVDLWMTAYALLYWWILSRLFAVTVFHLVLLRRVGSSRIEVRLFDRGPGRPFARVALRWVVMVLAIPFVIVGIGLAWGAAIPAVAGTVFLANVVLMVAALLLPASGLRRRIRAVKRAEIVRVEKAIAGNPEALAGSMIAADAGRLRLVDLLAYRRELMAVREWPYDSPALTRFVILLLLPVVSWILAALVERLVDALLAR
jgi:hypothetical protein